MSQQLEEVQKMSEKIKEIAAKYKVNKVGVFGSVARDEEEKGGDIDFLVTFADGVTITDWLSLVDELQDLLKQRVDVVSDHGLQTYDNRIKEEAIWL